MRFDPEKFTQDTKILFLSIPCHDPFSKFQELKKILSKHQIEASYALEEEWELKSKGISNPEDSTYFKLLTEQGYTHLLFFNDLEKKPANSFLSYYTDYELDLYQQGYSNVASSPETTHRSSVVLHLVSLEKNSLVYTDKVETSISPLKSPDKNGGEVNINFGDTSMATIIAIKKSVKRMIKDNL